MSGFDAASAARAMPGESVSGDAALVVPDDGSLLVAVVDGLGHGPGAAEAADVALETVRANTSLPLDALLTVCDRAMAHTRGAAMVLLRFTRGPQVTLDHVGVGNVATLVRSRLPIHPVAQPGIVGRRVRRVTVTRHVLGEGDLVAVFSDGVRTDLDLEGFHQREASRIVEAILRDHAVARDDASCAVVRVLGPDAAV